MSSATSSRRDSLTARLYAASACLRTTSRKRRVSLGLSGPPDGGAAAAGVSNGRSGRRSVAAGISAASALAPAYMLASDDDFTHHLWVQATVVGEGSRRRERELVAVAGIHGAGAERLVVRH